MTVPTLLTIPNYSPQAGKLPALPEGYTGYYQSLTCQMVFAFGFREKKGLVYLSKDGWQPHECSPSRLAAGHLARLTRSEMAGGLLGNGAGSGDERGDGKSVLSRSSRALSRRSKSFEVKLYLSP